MLTGNLLRVRFQRDKVLPQYLDADSPDWQAAAADLIDLYGAAVGSTRGEVEIGIEELTAGSHAALVLKGLASLLDDRCEYETVAERPPEEVREAVFRTAAQHRAAAAAGGLPFQRQAVLARAAEELGVAADRIEPLLFADLRDEQRILKFEGISSERLLERYNVALAQAVLLRSTGMQVRVRGETPARFRQLFRAIRFRRLIATIREEPGGDYAIHLDGPLSLFTATRQYGVNLAFFLPTLLHCKSFELSAELRWGAARRPMNFELTSEDGLKSYLPDFGVYTPKEFELFAASFRQNVVDWVLHDDPHPLPLPDGVWVPDFTLTHTPTGAIVYLEMFGYWRKVDIDRHVRRLARHLPRQFLIAVGEPLRADRDSTATWPAGVVPYKRTPSAEAIARAARQLLQ